MTRRSRHAAPTLIRDGEPTVSLEHLGSHTDFREDFVQRLVHEHPDILPMMDIEPAFTPLVSICRELPTPAGYLDNLWISPAGAIVLGECKLMRNPQSRREVVVQALDYARAIHRWSYEDLEGAVRKANRGGPSLWELIGDRSDLAEEQFVDAIERRLRFGRFMMLVIGDGIQEGVEALTDFLQLHAGLHTSIALVDLSFWREPGGATLVVPRIPAKTVLIERGIVTVDAGEVLVRPAVERATQATAVTASEPEFLQQLEERLPGVTPSLLAFLEKVKEIGIEPEYRKSLILRFHPSPDVSASAGYIETSGRCWFGDGWGAAAAVGRQDTAEQYLESLAAIIGGSLRRYETRQIPLVVDARGKMPLVTAFLADQDHWMDAIRTLVGVVERSSVER